MDRHTPKYIALKEAKRDYLWVETGRGAMKYEIIKKWSDKMLVGACIKEIRTRERQINIRSKWERMRNEFFEQSCGKGINKKKYNVEQLITDRLRDARELQRYNHIVTSKYNCKSVRL